MQINPGVWKGGGTRDGKSFEGIRQVATGECVASKAPTDRNGVRREGIDESILDEEKELARFRGVAAWRLFKTLTFAAASPSQLAGLCCAARVSHGPAAPYCTFVYCT